MRRRHQRAGYKNESGFTLIELLIVIVILGVLAAVAVFAVRGITDTGDEAACKTNVTTVETAVEAYYAKYGTNPPGATSAERMQALITNGLLKRAPSSSQYSVNIAADGTVSVSGNAPAGCS
jgi:prepilin-type N-terminal cleavage/methylation domain-containing protein